MNTEREQYPEYQLSDEETAAILAEHPDATLVADYMAGVLTEAQAVAFRERLRLDESFRRFADPRLQVWQAIPVVEAELSDDDVDESLQLFQGQQGIAVSAWRSGGRGRVAATDPTALQLEVLQGVRLLRLAAVLLLVVGIPVAGWVGYQAFPAVRTQGSHMRVARNADTVITTSAGSTVTLERGTRLVWVDRPDLFGDREMVLLNGAATFHLKMEMTGAWVIVTPAGRVRVHGVRFRIDVNTPTDVSVWSDEGDLLLEAAGVATITSPLRLTAGHRGRLLWGQPPRREP